MVISESEFKWCTLCALLKSAFILMRYHHQSPLKVSTVNLRILLASLLLALAGTSSAVTPSITSLEEIKQIAATGALDLSIQILEREQAALEKQPARWMSWERQRIEFYKSKKQWQRIEQRLAVLPDFADVDYIFWAKTQRAIALIRLRQGEQARQELRSLIWNLNIDKQTDELLTSWRRLIIDSYLVDGRAGDAQMASLRLRQDTASPDQKQELDDVLVRARIAILNNQADEAISLLKPYNEQPDTASLMLLAQLRGQTRSAKHIMQAAFGYLRDKEINEELKINLWAVVAESAQQQGKRGIKTKAIEHILTDRQNLSLPKSIYQVDSDGLWNAYIDYALSISNQEQLLIGEDQKWLDVAGRIKNKQPVGARAMAVFVMLRSQSAEFRQQAASRFVELLEKRKVGNRLFVELFQDSKYFSEARQIPKPVRHKLVDIALANSDIDRASELMATIEEPPEDSDHFMWWLRRARILVLGNQAEVGARALAELLQKNKQLDQEQIDKLLQVVFDLQTAGKHELAYGLFEQVLGYSKDEKIQREIYYWMADSRKSQERYAEAAQLYLKSAMHPDPENMDPWAQTAHYQAAESLARAGLYDDARTLFKRLLKVTEDPTRRATLQRELHRLWAMQ